VKLTIPWCRTHKALETRGTIAFALSTALALLAAAIVTEVLAGNAIVAIIVGIIVFFASAGILFWILGPREHSGWLLRDNSDLGHIAFSFDNPQYLEMFARTNDWEPVPTPYPASIQSA
jgi:hypothetical protein